MNWKMNWVFVTIIFFTSTMVTVVTIPGAPCTQEDEPVTQEKMDTRVPGVLVDEQKTAAGITTRVSKQEIQQIVDTKVKQLLQEDVKKMKFTFSGAKSWWSGSASYLVHISNITEADFPSLPITLLPKSNEVKVTLRGVKVVGNGKLTYKVKQFFPIASDSIKINVAMNEGVFSMSIKVGVTNIGQPTVSLSNCQAHIGSLDIDIRGSMLNWVWDILKGGIEDKVKKSINDKLCNILRSKVKEFSLKKIQTFPLVRKIDKVAEIDFRLTRVPAFATDYIEIFSKGEIRSICAPKQSRQIVQPWISTSEPLTKDVYVWINEHTFNTASEVYQQAGELNFRINGWDKNIPEMIRRCLNTSFLIPFVPNLKQYANLSMAMRLVTKQAPNLSISTDVINVRTDVDVQSFIRMKNGSEIEAFISNVPINITGSVGINGRKIVGKVRDLQYNVRVMKSDVGVIDLKMFKKYKDLVSRVILKFTNLRLAQGFSIPSFFKQFQDLDIHLRPHVVRFGADIHSQLLKYISFDESIWDESSLHPLEIASSATVF